MQNIHTLKRFLAKGFLRNDQNSIIYPVKTCNVDDA